MIHNKPLRQKKCIGTQIDSLKGPWSKLEAGWWPTQGHVQNPKTRASRGQAQADIQRIKQK